MAVVRWLNKQGSAGMFVDPRGYVLTRRARRAPLVQNICWRGSTLAPLLRRVLSFLLKTVVSFDFSAWSAEPVPLIHLNDSHRVWIINANRTSPRKMGQSYCDWLLAVKASLMPS